MFRLLTVLLLTATCFAASDFTKSVTRTLNADNVKRIEVFTTNGNIIIEPAETDQIILTATKKVKGSENDKERLLQAIQIETIENNGVLTIRVKRNKIRKNFFSWVFNIGHGDYSVNLKLRIPEHLNVKARSTNGEIDLRSIKGTLELATTNGDIKALDIDNVEEIHSTNGKIKAEFTSLQQTNEAEISTTNGKIEVLLPKTVKCNIRAFTNNGHINCQLPHQNSTSQDNHLEIKVGKEYPTLLLKTTNGDISIFTR